MRKFRIKLFIVFIIIVQYCLPENSFSQDSVYTNDLVPLYEIEGSYNDDDEKCRVIPKHSLKKYYDMKLYYNDSLIFAPDENFKHFFYEIFKEKYIIVTFIYDPSSSLRLPIKSLVRVISLSDVYKIYEANLQGCLLQDIDIEQRIVYVRDFIDNEIIKIDLIELD